MKITTKVVTVVQRNNQILLIREWSNKRNGYFWNLIKGTFGDHIESLEDCAKREVFEEAGLDVEIDHLISTYLTASKNVRIQFNFLSHLVNKDRQAKITDKQDQKKRGEDIVEVKWVEKNEILNWSEDQFVNKLIYKAIVDCSANRKNEFEIITI